MNPMKYNELLEEVLVQYMEENLDEDFIFQQDNTSIHASFLSCSGQHAVLIVTLLKISGVY